MRLLDRYLLRELLVPLGYCLCGFLLLWISSDLIADLGSFQEKKLQAGDIAEGAAIAVFLFPLLVAVAFAFLRVARRTEVA